MGWQELTAVCGAVLAVLGLVAFVGAWYITRGKVDRHERQITDLVASQIAHLAMLNNHILEDARTYVKSQDIGALESRFEKRFDAIDTNIREMPEQIIKALSFRHGG